MEVPELEVNISKETKIEIIKNHLEKVDNTLYSLTVQCKVSNSIGDTPSVEIIKKDLEKFISMQDGYKKELKLLEEG